MTYQVACIEFSDVIRPLNAHDVDEYRMLRKRILEIGDGRYFSDSFVREAALGKQGWTNWCTETQSHCIFGRFVNGQLIAVMMVTQYGDIEDKTVEWEAIWVEPKFRNKGYGRSIYQEIEKWSLAHGYKRVVVFIRADNERSQEIHIRQGAVFTGIKRNEIWADGSVEDVLCFELSLPTRKHKSSITHLNIIKRQTLDEVPFLQSA